ncbi:hypothetical protein ABMA70_13075 [Halobacteriovorax sp. XZX-3]|uniref:hypothetical protein n=1 Tax=unclassified Halobacteriovorax TaxID=2639665 RepID=UPI00371EA283
MMKKVVIFFIITFSGVMLIDTDVETANVSVVERANEEAFSNEIILSDDHNSFEEVEIVNIEDRIEKIEIKIYESDDLSSAIANDLSKTILSLKESSGIEVDTLDKLSNAERAYIILKNIGPEDFYQLSYQDKDILMEEFGGRAVLSEYYYKHEVLGENYDLPNPNQIRQLRSLAQSKIIDEGDSTMMVYEGNN